MKTVHAASIAIGFAVLLTPAAFAGHGKAGLWESTIQMSGMPGMPDMSNLPPEAQAAMRSHGMQMGGNTITSKFCMTPAQVAADQPVYKHDAACQPQNVKFVGNTYSADVVCTGAAAGTRGHIEITFLSADHWKGVQSTDMVQEGHKMHTTMNMEGKWISPNCGNVH
jgi:hypothetical protein